MKIILQNTQPLLGDRLMFTPVVRDLKKSYPDWQIGIISAGPEIWYNNPNIDKTIIEANADEIYDIGPGKVTRGSKTNGLHITTAFRCSLEEKLGKPIQQGPFKPDIYLSEKEKQIRLVEGRYWVINIDCGPFSAKRWPDERFQQLVESLPQITFVQVGLARDNRYRLRGDNVIDMVNRTKIRELFSLVYYADGCISLVSSLMHVAAAFDKPCVVIAGGREPPTFERYPMHRFIDNVGTLKCAAKQACWHNALSACKDHDGKTARCMRMIKVQQVKEAVESYYEGGLLDWPNPKFERAKCKPILRIVANTKCLGGAERSVIQIAKMFLNNHWQVELASTTSMASSFRETLSNEIVITNHVTRHCDILLFYASDMVFGFDQDRFNCFNHLQADKKVMALTYKLGKAGQMPWTQGWDKYLFLSTALEKQFRLKTQDSRLKTAVLAPTVDLEPFLSIELNYKLPIRMVHHSSQGDKKFPVDLLQIMLATEAEYKFMPGPSWLKKHEGIKKIAYSDKVKDVADFLGSGNCFWYLLPDGYTDQGPRVIVEAMAAGLPVIAENRDGAADRVTDKTGWLIDSHDQAIEIINSLTPEILSQKGQAARDRAKTEFVAERWYEEITDGM